MRLDLPVVKSDSFNWYPEDRTFSAYASDLPNINYLSRVYDDACDAGFGIKSAKTGCVVEVALVHTDEDHEGEIGGWWFEPIDSNAPKFRVLIIND